MSALKHSQPKQLTLPLEVLQDELNPEYLEIVKQNWKITFSRQHMTSVHVRRVMGLIAAQIREDNEVKEYYQITADKIIRETNLDRFEVYKLMKGVVYELANVCYFIEDEDSGTLIPRHLLDTTRFKYPAGYVGGTLTVAFNPQLNGIVNQLAHYAPFELNQYVNFSSWYSIRLYELLYAFKDKDNAEWDIENYREWMGCGVEWDRQGNPKTIKKTGKPKYIKYSNHADAIERTTREPLKEFKGTNLEFKVSPVYSTGGGRGRPSIKKVRFDFVWERKSSVEKIAVWVEGSEKFKAIYERLKRWRVSDENIVKYAKAIGHDGLNKLMIDWQEKNKTKEPILSPLKYCNSEIVRVGKEKLK